ncbi:hypothetical protein [Marinobacterium arenosum]|uniref:hypothetical protein n=1 Tax=Marinobacterium arenosum TaxID=2862496 RepID=UPI001C945FDE|nr:hypothetical protein [Marinobacterium arenosum]MBY4677384.1 hypothetical protein [Marinobacterium arenosum]
MEKQHLVAQLKQLLRSGYSIDDVRNLVIGPRILVEQAIAEYQAQSLQREQQQRPLRQQAEYAMYLGSAR